MVLRPLDVGEILDRALKVYRRNFIELTEIVALALVPTTLLLIGSIVFLSDTTIIASMHERGGDEGERPEHGAACERVLTG